MIQITRTAFCDKCHKAGRPKVGDWYATMGRNNPDTYMLRTVKKQIHRDRLGFVPHLFTLVSKNTKSADTHSICAMNGCGIRVEKNKEVEDEYDIFYNKFYLVHKPMALTEWNALVMYTDSDYWL